MYLPFKRGGSAARSISIRVLAAQGTGGIRQGDLGRLWRPPSCFRFSALFSTAAPLGCGTVDSALDFMLFSCSLSPDGFQSVVQQQHSQKQQKQVSAHRRNVGGPLELRAWLPQYVLPIRINTSIRPPDVLTYCNTSPVRYSWNRKVSEISGDVGNGSCGATVRR